MVTEVSISRGWGDDVYVWREEENQKGGRESVAMRTRPVVHGGKKSVPEDLGVLRRR